MEKYKNQFEQDTIYHFLNEVNNILSSEDLANCFTKYKDSYKSLTCNRKIDISNTKIIPNQDLTTIPLDQFELIGVDLSNSKVNREQFEYIYSYIKTGKMIASNIDIEGLDLRGFDFYIEEKYLKYIDLSNISFSGVKLDAYAIHSMDEILSLNKIDLAGADMNGVEMCGKYVEDYELGFHGFCYFDISHYNLHDINFDNAKINCAILDNSNFSNSSFVNAEITESSANNAIFHSSILTNCNLQHSDFQNASFDNAILKNAKI